MAAMDELNGDADALARLADASFEYRGDVQPLRHRRDIDLAPFEAERRRVRRYPQAADLGQHVEKLLRDPVGKVLVRRIVAHGR